MKNISIPFLVFWLIWIIVVGVVYFAPSSYGASDPNFWDCQEFNSVPQRPYYTEYPNVYPQKLVERAYKNLRNYCCVEFRNRVDDAMLEFCEDNETKHFAESPVLYDHFIDLWFRALDGVKDLQYEDAPVDTGWVLWREHIVNFWTDPYGAIPLDVMSKYVEFRGDKWDDKFITQSKVESCWNELPRLEDLNDEWDDIPLTLKYYTMCEVSSCLAYGNKNIEMISRCHNLAQKRTLQEDDLVRAVVITQGANYIDTEFTMYAKAYINHTRFDNLLEKFNTMKVGLNFINSKVHEYTRMCSGEGAA